MPPAIRETLRLAETPVLRALLCRPVEQFRASDYVDDNGRCCLLGVLEGWGLFRGQKFRARSIAAPLHATADWDAAFLDDPHAAVTALRAEVRAVLAERGES